MKNIFVKNYVITENVKIVRYIFQDKYIVFVEKYHLNHLFYVQNLLNDALINAENFLTVGTNVNLSVIKKIVNVKKKF